VLGGGGRNGGGGRDGGGMTTGLLAGGVGAAGSGIGGSGVVLDESDMASMGWVLEPVFPVIVQESG
jgi:hypothetical protein